MNLWPFLYHCNWYSPFPITLIIFNFFVALNQATSTTNQFRCRRKWCIKLRRECENSATDSEINLWHIYLLQLIFTFCINTHKFQFFCGFEVKRNWRFFQKLATFHHESIQVQTKVMNKVEERVWLIMP